LRIEFPSYITFKISITVSIIYFLWFVPFWKFIFNSSNPWSNFYFESFSLISVICLVYCKKIKFSQEFDSKKVFFRNLFIGLGLGSLLLLFLFVFSYLLTLTGINDKNFSVGKPIYPIINGYSDLVYLIKNLVFSFIDQIVFLTVFVQPLIKRFNLIIAVYLSAILFVFLHLNLTLGYFGMGLVCSALFGLTGSILPAILFQLFSTLIALLLLNHFSELLPIVTLFF
jgi:membrane protease YdiL (CAAX protease family)